MASVYSKSLQIYSAEQFKKSIDSTDEPYIYFTFGKVDPWFSETSPPQPNTSVNIFNDVWKNMIGAKNVLGNDVRLAIRRNDWTANTAYHAYDDCSCSLNMNDANVKFYVVTDEWNVYKCLANNYGSNSTVKPTSTLTTSAVETSDRYIWKYMYTLTEEERLRFVTDDYIPVRTLKEDNGSLQWQVQNAAVSGGIEAIKVVSQGSGYSNTNDTVTITGDGTDAQAVLFTNAATGAIESIRVTDRGVNYTNATVSISTTTGVGASARAIISPPSGHGADPVEELGGSHVIINVRLRNTEDNILDVQNEFRHIALIKNPIIYNSTQIASNLVYSQTTSFIMSGSGDYIEDEIVFQGSSVATASYKGRVASWNNSTNRLELIDTYGTPEAGILFGDTSRVARSAGLPQEKDLKPYTGELLYVDFIEPIQRSADQTEDFKIVISF